LLRERWKNAGLTGNADARFLVIGEELSLPFALLQQARLDALWNDRFRELIRAAIVGESAGGENFEGTIRKAIDCRGLGFDDGARAVNYLTSHDVEGFRKERLWNFLGSSGVGDIEERKKRIKLGFACLLTAVGIPMILAGEEFGDEHDRFDSAGHVTQDGGKQVDPVNYSRVEDPSRGGLVTYVSRLIKLRIHATCCREQGLETDNRRDAASFEIKFASNETSRLARAALELRQCKQAMRIRNNDSHRI
jgi:pullulanase